jgi:hypothetical protein
MRGPFFMPFICEIFAAPLVENTYRFTDNKILAPKHQLIGARWVRAQVYFRTEWCFKYKLSCRTVQLHSPYLSRGLHLYQSLRWIWIER